MADRPIRLVGIGGYSRSGKDVVANYFIGRYGFVRVGLADALKQEVAQRFRKLLAIEAKRVYGDQLNTGRATLDEAIYRLLWIERTDLTRALLQCYGTEVRRADNPDYWRIKLAVDLRDMDKRGRRVAVPDCRFSNEIELIRSYHGLLLWVERPGIGPESDHASEITLTRESGWDMIVPNDGSKEDLYAKLDDMLRLFKTRLESNS